MELFAQGGGGGGGGAGAAGILFILMFYAAILFVVILLQVLFLLSMSRCLQQVSARNRQMSPGQVWLCLIPLFGLVWTIIMMIRIADSLRDEYYDRGLRGDGDFGKTLGIIYIVSAFCCGPVALICWIMYWVKISGYTNTLRSNQGYDDYDDDDYEERRPRRRRDRDDDDDRDDDRDDRGGGRKPWERR